MNPDSRQATSRPLGVAHVLNQSAIDEDAVYSKIVVLTGEVGVLATPNGRWCFLAAMRLLSRVVGELIVVLPAGLPELGAEARQTSMVMWTCRTISVVTAGGNVPWADVAAVLNVGTRVISGTACTVINSNGWVARASNGAPLPGDVSQANALGALMAASLGATEVFKRIFEVPAEIAAPVGLVQYSLFEQSTVFSGLGPQLPPIIQLPDTVLVGGGAIGNGIAWLLAYLPVAGRLFIIDKQAYGFENLGTCILMEREGWLAEPKAERLAAWIKRTNRGLTVDWKRQEIHPAKVDGLFNSMAVDLVINALDDTEARREAQGLWPSVLVDGGISEVGAAVTQFRLDRAGMACMRCRFEAAVVDERVEQSRLTGLSPQSLRDLDRVIDDRDIEMAAPEKRDWLIAQKKQGKKICSIVSIEGMRELGVEVSDKFQPSVPFVATASAAMTMAEAIKALLWPAVRAMGQVQIANLFRGAEDTLIATDRPPTKTCQCVVHRGPIERVAKRRLLRR